MTPLSPDAINGLFEIFGGLFIFNHCRVLVKDKEVKGVSILSVVCFSTWGFWNLYYYPHLNQMLSFYGGIITAAANFTYVSQLIYYKFIHKRK